MHHLISILALATVAAVTALAAAPAQAETVVIVSQKNPATRLIAEQVSPFFLGKSSLFTPLDQPESSPIRTDFYRKVANKDPAQIKALWAKLVFTGKATPPKEYAGNSEVKKAVAADPKAIGYIDKSAVDDSVKVILTLP